MLDRFQEAAEAVGTKIKRFPSLAEAGSHIRELAGNSLVCSSGLPVEISIACNGITFASPGEAATAQLCVSVAKAGIAETGSLLLELTDPGARGATALPPVHAVVLPAAAIVPSLCDLAGELEKSLCAPGAAYLSLTTGPSRTADIERVLTIGVHGPKELHVLIVEGA